MTPLEIYILTWLTVAAASVFSLIVLSIISYIDQYIAVKKLNQQLAINEKLTNKIVNYLSKVKSIDIVRILEK